MLHSKLVDPCQRNVVDKAMKRFMRLINYEFSVNYRYVRRKISIILMPFFSRIWSRQRGMDSATYERLLQVAVMELAT